MHAASQGKTELEKEKNSLRWSRKILVVRLELQFERHCGYRVEPRPLSKKQSIGQKPSKNVVKNNTFVVAPWNLHVTPY